MIIYVVIGCYYCSLCLECGLTRCKLEGDPPYTRRLKSRRKSRYYHYRPLLRSFPRSDEDYLDKALAIK